jgi:hypothetical protein
LAYVLNSYIIIHMNCMQLNGLLKCETILSVNHFRTSYEIEVKIRVNNLFSGPISGPLIDLIRTSLITALVLQIDLTLLRLVLLFIV